jgi:hypothetical protein
MPMGVVESAMVVGIVCGMCGTAKRVADERLAAQDQTQLSETTVDRVGATAGITKARAGGPRVCLEQVPGLLSLC